jgi:hypothetical protein
MYVNIDDLKMTKNPNFGSVSGISVLYPKLKKKINGPNVQNITSLCIIKWKFTS